MQQTGRTGWYFRVLHEGHVAVGSLTTLTDRPLPDWTVERANRVMHHLKDDAEQATALAALPLLSASWRSTLRFRAGKHDSHADVQRRLNGPTAGGS